MVRWNLFRVFDWRWNIDNFSFYSIYEEKKMKIVLAGYPKTGTKTSTAALEILGILHIHLKRRRSSLT